ncbi:MAG: helix-turn-helix transcriptional regulator [Kiritimatiellae bacterium]|nr:helix-turn-helix transcriptional regulator [Kiritimatiellia bacterium]
MRAYGIDVRPLPAFVNAAVARGRPGYVHVRQQLRVNEVFVVEEGTLFMENNGVRAKVEPGGVLFHPTGTTQQGYAPSPESVKFVWLTFRTRVSAHECSELRVHQIGEYITQKELTRSRTDQLFVPALSRPAHFAEILDFGYRLAERGTIYPIERSAYVCLILSRLSVSGFVDRRPRLRSKEARLVNDIKCRIERQLAAPLSPGMVAEEVGMNADYLSRIFRRTTGLRLSEYIAIRKMEQARLLLRAGRSVKETAFRTGHTRAEHFSRKFKKHTGFPPSVYAQMAGDIYRN